MKEEHIWLVGGLAALVVGFVIIKKASATNLAAQQKANAQFTTYGKAAGEAGQAGTGQTTVDLLALSNPSHIFTVGEVQYLLNKWGSNPPAPMTGSYDDTTDLAVRDFQTRGQPPPFGKGPYNFGTMNIDGDPFEIGTTRALQAFAATLLQSGGQAQLGISISDLQTLFQPYVPITGVMDAATQARLNLYAPMLSPPYPKGTQLSLSDPRVQTYFLAMAKQQGLSGF